MNRWRLHLRLLSWITTCVVLFGSMAPAVSSTLAWAAGGGLPADVCSAAGNTVANGATSDQAPALPDHAGGVHCPFCLLPGHDAVLPSTAGTAVSGPALGSPRLHVDRSTKPVTAPRWTPAAPRGPPSISA